MVVTAGIAGVLNGDGALASAMLHVTESAGFPSLRPSLGTEYDFQQPRRIGSTRLDHAFTDLNRDQDGLARVELRDPDRGMKVSLWLTRATRTS
jgi:hypothetical protein